MGAEVDWVPGIIATLVGVVLGVMLAVRARRGPTGPSDELHAGRSRAEARAIRIEDLKQRKLQLLTQIRDNEDTALASGLSSAQGERANLEEEAAKVLRELHHLEQRAAPAQGAPSAASAASAATPAGQPAPSPDQGGMSPALKGGLTGGAVVGFAALLLFSLQTGTAERKGNMPMTGGDLAAESTADLPPPGAGRPGDPVPGVPPTLQPKPSQRVDAARAAVTADPTNVDKLVDLGWALVDAEGWIDVFNNAEQLLKLAPGNPDARVQQAIVRVRMGQSSVAEGLIDEALGLDPNHGRGLAWKGSIRWQQGDVAAAKASWSKGQELYPTEGFKELLAMADGEVKPERLGAPPAPRTSQPAETSQPATAGRPAPITGHVQIPEGTNFPPGAVLFLYARPSGQIAGPPLAAIRLRPSIGPVPFSIGPDNLIGMGGNRPFPASVSLAARLDFDGNAGTKDGISGAVPEPVAAGSEGVVITLAP